MMSSSRWWLVGAAVIGACGDSGSSGTERPAVVVRTDPASLADCPYGGSVVSSGLDENQNQVLDDAEIKTRTDVCNDASAQPPPPVVVRLVAEPKGDHCAEGGTAVQSGPDRNGNAQLDDDEVTHTDYVCGQAPVTRIVAEPEGAHCVAGGVAFLTGPDRNGNGQLDDDEIEQTQYECGDVLWRGVTVRSSADLAALANIRAIKGDLVIDDLSVEQIALPALEELGDSLVVLEDHSLWQISLPHLRSIGGAIFIQDDPVLTTVDLSTLVHIGSDLVIGSNPQLTDLTGFPTGISLGRDIFLDRNASLTAVKLPFSAGGGAVEVTNNPALAALDVFADRLDHVTIVNNGVEHVRVVASSFGAGTVVVGSVMIGNNPELVDLSVSADRPDRVTIQGNAVLGQVTMFAGAIGHDIQIFGNPRLDTVALYNLNHLFEPLEIGGSLFISGPVHTFSLAPIVVDGDCTFDGTQLTAVGWSLGLDRVGGTLRVAHNLRVQDIALTSIGGGLEVIDNPALLGGVLGNQAEYHGDVVISDNPLLGVTQLLAGVRWIQGGLTISNNAHVLSTMTDALTEVDGLIVVQDNPVLVDLALGALKTVTNSTLVRRNALLATVELPALTDASNGIEVMQNASLRHLAIPQLTFADFRVEDNPRLPTCEVDLMFSRMGGRHVQSGNDDVTVCAPLP